MDFAFRKKDKEELKRGKSKKSSKRSSSAPAKRSTTRVSFDAVLVREYERSVGDNPAVSSGVPIGLGWTYARTESMEIDVYETHVRKQGPRTRKDFFLTPQQRFHMLLDEWGFSVRDICRAKDEASEVRYQRHVSVFGEAVMKQQAAAQRLQQQQQATKQRAEALQKQQQQQQKRSSSSSSSKSSKSRSKRSSSGKLPKMPKAADRWNAYPAEPIAN